MLMRQTTGVLILLIAPSLALQMSTAGEEQKWWGQEPVKAVVVQFETRKPLPESRKTLLSYNEHYFSNLPGHKYIFLDADSLGDDQSSKSEALKEDCHVKPGTQQVVGPNGCMLHGAWGKVKAMMKATEMYPQAEYFLFMDSDMAFNYKYHGSNFGVDDLYSGLATANGENTFYVASSPYITEQMLDVSSFNIGINTAALVWKAGKPANDALKTWWMSSFDDYDFANPLDKDGARQKFRNRWPWEQNRLTAIMNEPAYHDTGNLFSPVPAKNDFHVRPDAEKCNDGFQFVAEVPYDLQYACPLLHYTSPNVGTKVGNEDVQFDMDMMTRIVDGTAMKPGALLEAHDGASGDLKQKLCYDGFRWTTCEQPEH